jgi:lipoprotein-releasing system permease protein
VAIGKYLAAKLNAARDSVITVTVPAEQNGTFMPNSATYTVTNVYDTGFFEFDTRWVFIDLQEAGQLLGTTSVNLIEVKLSEGTPLEGMGEQIRLRTGEQYAVTDWRQMNSQLFQLLAVQQLVLFIVIGLIVFVSTFNIVSTLIMTVHEKRREIGILASMGADRNLIRRVFLWYGTMVGAAGTFAGILLGVLVSWVITRYELVSFGPEIAEVYFVSSIPFVTRWEDLTAIALFTVTVSFLATVLPSLRAARLNPVDALRHE